MLNNCTLGNYVCQKQIIINDKECDLKVILYPDLTLQIDGYKFTVDQLQKSIYTEIKSFMVSKVGNAIVFISHLQGFWVRFDELGDVKIGVAAKYSSGVDGLCGYFNGDASDDKRLPNGKITLSSVDFGDGWYVDKRSKKHCEPHACPQHVQNTAWDLCNKIKDEAFAPCMKAMDIDRFISKCLETACDCLKSNTANVDQGRQKTCKCSILQSFVAECLATNEQIVLDTWRARHDCPASCVAPLVYKDCYRRRCEPSCDLLMPSDCPHIPGVCFTGCYCPEGMVRKGDICVPVSECKNCICDGFGRSQYITYDRKNFTFDGNCTYLLTRDLLVPDAYNFQIYVSLGSCNDEDNSITLTNNIAKHSCVKALRILYGMHTVVIEKSGLENKVSAMKNIVDGALVMELPLIATWVKITEVQGKGININFIESQLELSIMCDELSFSIRLPNVKYAGKLEGLCGDCNGNPTDDLKLNPKYKKKVLSNDINSIIESWLADEPALKVEEQCVKSEEIKDCVLLPEHDPCQAILDQSIFGQCHLLADPTMYVSMCQADICKTGAKEACSHLAAYASQCSRHGLCIDWKKGKCDSKIECPADMVYEACGCQKTCDSIKDKKNTELIKCSNPTEGCYCPPGKVLNNDKCIPVKECTQCGPNHFVGDQWYPDKCTLCECGDKGKVNCTKKDCNSVGIVCQLGYKQITVDQPDECCPIYKCVPEIKESDKCSEPALPNCASDQFNKMITDNNNCSKYVCECKPIDQCKADPEPKLLPGEAIVTETSGCCPKKKVICDKSKCPSKPEKCDDEFHELIKDDSSTNNCCDTFKCIPPKNQCIVEVDGKKKLRNIGEIWSTKEPCIHKKCAFGSNGLLVAVDEKQICPVTQCPLGFTLKIPIGECCGDCVQDKCIFNGTLYETDKEWQSKDLCTKYKCSQQGTHFVITTMMPTCPDIKDCPSESRYFENCCERCKIKVEDKSKYLLFVFFLCLK